MEISTKFAYLPNGIIRNIIAYTGATYKKRNGKYMGQIPKTDMRYVLLLTIPTKKIWSELRRPTYEFFYSSVNLTCYCDETDRFDLNPSVYMNVCGMKYTNDPDFGNLETINYDIKICDWKGNKRIETFEYFRYDEKYDKFLADITKLKCLIKKTYILIFMFAIDFIIREVSS